MQLRNRRHLTRTDHLQISNTRILQCLKKTHVFKFMTRFENRTSCRYIYIFKTLNVSYSVTLFKKFKNLNFYKDISDHFRKWINIGIYLFVIKEHFKFKFS